MGPSTAAPRGSSVGRPSEARIDRVIQRVRGSVGRSSRGGQGRTGENQGRTVAPGLEQGPLMSLEQGFRRAFRSGASTVSPASCVFFPRFGGLPHGGTFCQDTWRNSGLGSDSGLSSRENL